MPYHYSYLANPELDSLRLLLKAGVAKGRVKEDVIKKTNNFRYDILSKEKDIAVITAELLIENIDYAVKSWEKRPWSRYYSFEDFCEYILPYRLGNEQLEKWRRVYYDKYNSILDSLYQGTDVVEAAQTMTSYLQTENFLSYVNLNLPRMGALFLFENRVGYCKDACDVACYALGIPIAIDMYQVSPSYNSKHFWNAIIDTTGMAVPFNYDDQIPVRGVYNDRKRGKVYRELFCIREVDRHIMSDHNILELFRNPFLRDVTEEYYPNDGFNTIVPKENTEEYICLAIYDPQNYTPIDIAKVQGEVAEFKNIEDNLVYHPIIYRDRIAIPTGYPFLLQKGSKPVYFIPDMHKKHEVTLTRKYPMRNNYLGRSIGVKIEGAQTIDFKNPKLLYEVVDTPLINYNKINLSQDYNCRYIHMVNKRDRMEIAEIAFFTKAGEKVDVSKWWRMREDLSGPFNGKPIFDSDWVSYYPFYPDEHIYFDFGKIQSIGSIVFISRNDGNFIHLGDTYELFFQNGANDCFSAEMIYAETRKMNL